MVEFDIGNVRVCQRIRNKYTEEIEEKSIESLRTGVEYAFPIYVNSDVEIGDIREGSEFTISGELYRDISSTASNEKGNRRALFAHIHPGDPFPSRADMITFADMISDNNVWNGNVIFGMLDKDLIQINSIEVNETVPDHKADDIKDDLIEIMGPDNATRGGEDREFIIGKMIDRLAEFGETCETTWTVSRNG